MLSHYIWQIIAENLVSMIVQTQYVGYYDILYQCTFVHRHIIIVRLLWKLYLQII